MTMKGWILVENNEPVFCSNNSLKIFMTKKDLLDFYGGALGKLNSLKKVSIYYTSNEE